MLYPQIMQTKGSYSFLLCGMIIACIGFILFIGLLLFHRMHRNYLAGTSLPSASSSDALPLISPRSLISYPSAPSLTCTCSAITGTTKKSAMVEEQVTEQNGSARTEQKEESATSWGSPSAAVAVTTKASRAVFVQRIRACDHFLVVQTYFCSVWKTILL